MAAWWRRGGSVSQSISPARYIFISDKEEEEEKESKFGAHLQNGGVEGNRRDFFQLEEHATHSRPEAETPHRTPYVGVGNIRKDGGRQHHQHPPLH